jgi:hypothetical protein
MQRNIAGEADVAAAVGDLLPSAFDLLYTSLDGKQESHQVRGIAARTLVEHLHMLIQGSIEQADFSTVAPIEAREAWELRTFDRYSSREVSRDDLLTRMSSRLGDNVIAQVAVALIELRTDLILKHTGYLSIDGVGKIEAESRIEASVDVCDLAELFKIAHSEWPSSRRARKWFLRSVADRLILNVAVRAPCIYNVKIPEIVMREPRRISEEARLQGDEIITYDVLFGRPEK